MNDTIKNILNRRSVRQYRSEQLKTKELESIIEAGLYAPSAMNQQSWHFTVIQNKNIIDNLNKDAKEALTKDGNEYFKKFAEDENYTIFYNAPTIIVISGEKHALKPATDCAAAVENMLIAAESLNIGTCWIGLVTPLFQSEKAGKYIELLNIPEGFEPYYAITLGYKTQENGEAPPRRENTVNFID